MFLSKFSICGSLFHFYLIAFSLFSNKQAAKQHSYPLANKGPLPKVSPFFSSSNTLSLHCFPDSCTLSTSKVYKVDWPPLIFNLFSFPGHLKRGCGPFPQNSNGWSSLTDKSQRDRCVKGTGSQIWESPCLSSITERQVTVLACQGQPCSAVMPNPTLWESTVLKKEGLLEREHMYLDKICCSVE